MKTKHSNIQIDSIKRRYFLCLFITILTLKKMIVDIIVVVFWKLFHKTHRALRVVTWYVTL